MMSDLQVKFHSVLLMRSVHVWMCLIVLMYDFFICLFECVQLWIDADVENNTLYKNPLK